MAYLMLKRYTDGAARLCSAIEQEQYVTVGERNGTRANWGSTAGVVGLITVALLVASPRMAEASGPTAGSSAASLSSALGPRLHPLGFIPSSPVEAAQFAGRVAPKSTFGRTAVPSSVDLTPFAPTPGDQGQLSSCVSWSVGYDLMGYYSNRTGHSGAPFAPMYVYSQVNGGVDQGSTFVDNFNLVAAQGIATKADYRPQGDYEWRQKPTAAQRASAAFHRALAPSLLFTGLGQGTTARTSISNALAAGQPVVIGIRVFNNFYYLSGSKSTFSNADISGDFLGYHAVTAFGYNASGIVIENSWGTGWGKAGFATLSWDFVQSNVIEAWTTAGFANPTVSVSPTAWASSGAGTPATITAQTGVLGASAAAFNTLGWKLSIGGVVVPLTWRSKTQVAFTAPTGTVGPASISLMRAGVASVISTPVAYVSSISALTTSQRADGSRLMTISGAGLSSGSQWNLVAPSGAVSRLTNSSSNDIASGALNRIWTASDGRFAIALVGAVDPVLRETGSYGISYVGTDGGSILAWPSGGVPFLAPTIARLSAAQVPNSVAVDVSVTGDGLAAFLSPYPSGVRLVSDATGLGVELTLKAKTVGSVTVTIPAGTATGAYHLVAWTPLGTSSASVNTAALSVVATGAR